MKYIKGIFLNRKETAPDFVIGTLSIKPEEFIEVYKDWTNSKGYINLDILRGKDGSYYYKPNTFGTNMEAGGDITGLVKEFGSVPSNEEINLDEINF